MHFARDFGLLVLCLVVIIHLSDADAKKGTVGALIGAGIPTTDAVNVDGDAGSVQHLMGCYEDKAERDLSVEKGSCGKMTPAVCDRLCRGYEYFAVQYMRECRCASEGWIPKYGKKPSKECKTPCKGESRHDR